MKKIILTIILCLFTITAFSLDGIVLKTEGKVQKQLTNGQWITLNQGDKISEQEVISTGFKSYADIKLGGSIVSIGQLTNINILTLDEQKDYVETNLFISSGACLSNIKPLNNKANKYKVQTPTVTCSVRGTVFGVSVNDLYNFDPLIEQMKEAIIYDSITFKNNSIAKPIDSLPYLEAAKGTEQCSILVPEGKIHISSYLSETTLEEGQTYIYERIEYVDNKIIKEEEDKQETLESNIQYELKNTDTDLYIQFF